VCRDPLQDRCHVLLDQGLLRIGDDRAIQAVAVGHGRAGGGERKRDYQRQGRDSRETSLHLHGNSPWVGFVVLCASTQQPHRVEDHYQEAQEKPSARGMVWVTGRALMVSSPSSGPYRRIHTTTL